MKCRCAGSANATIVGNKLEEQHIFAGNEWVRETREKEATANNSEGERGICVPEIDERDDEPSAAVSISCRAAPVLESSQNHLHDLTQFM